MSINKHKISETEYFKQYTKDTLKESWQKYLNAIDKEINFSKEWERSIEDRNKSK